MALRSCLSSRAAARCLLAAVLVLAAAACGRRGALEAPPGASAAIAAPDRAAAKPARGARTASQPVASGASLAGNTLDTPDDEADEPEFNGGVAPIPTPATPGTRKRGRGFTIPKEPFILDPIL